MLLKRILCFGDSNTFGYNPLTGSRYDKDSRWSGILSQLLKDKYEVVEEGMNNRTGFFKNPEGLKQSGADYLSVYWQNHCDFDIVILALGTNDAQIFYAMDEIAVEKGLKNLINIIQNANSKPEIILVPPVKITKDLFNGWFAAIFDELSIQRIEKTFYVFEKTAKENGCHYFDFNNFVRPSEYDGIHYTKDSHQIIADRFADFILSYF